MQTSSSVTIIMVSNGITNQLNVSPFPSLADGEKDMTIELNFVKYKAV